MGRPSKFSEAGFECILTALRDGNSRTAAARAGGVNDRSLRRWMDDDALRDMVEAAEAAAEAKHLAVVEKASDGGDWRAAAWWLERRRVIEWGRVDRVAVYQLHAQAEALSEELAAEGIQIGVGEILREREALAKRPLALPPGPGAYASKD